MRNQKDDYRYNPGFNATHEPIATHCNTLQHTATQETMTLQHTASQEIVPF